MRGGVAIDLLALLVLKREHLEYAVTVQYRGEILELPVDPDGNRRACQAFADGLGRLHGRDAGGNFLDVSVLEFQLHSFLPRESHSHS